MFPSYNIKLYFEKVAENAGVVALDEEQEAMRQTQSTSV